MLGDSAVPISLSYSDDITILIITGPNAGGKTVTLKTCGLFVLMNQFAAELPAAEGTALSIYNSIYADIGDDQSIEESLSTFSGHMKRISEITNNADKSSLVLLDELGSGTDPSQGSAIAMAVLEHMRAEKISTIVTTHHAAVKNFGHTRSGAVNASVSFDPETMKPTYEIIEGVPGESHAVEIAQTMGLPDSIIKEAGSLLDNGNADVSEMIRELERRQYQIIERDRRLAEEERKNREDRRALELTRLKLKQAQHEVAQRDYSMLKSYVSESRKELENLVRELREGEITKEKTLKVKRHIEDLEHKLESEAQGLDKLQDEISASEPGNNEDSPDNRILKPGMEIKNKKNGKTGVLLEQRKNGLWLASFGNIKLSVKESDIAAAAQKKKIPASDAVSSAAFSSNAVSELDLRGMRVYEAEAALIQQIDSAVLTGLNEFGVIHGLGEGVLQKTVHDFLRTCSQVKSFEFSDPEQGGFGKTIVKLAG